MTQAVPAVPRPERRLLPALWALLRLAVPVAGARFGIALLLACDYMVVGRYQGSALADLGLAMMVNQTFQTVSIGLLIGGMVESAAALGRGDRRASIAILRRSMLYALGLGAAVMLLAQAAPWFFAVAGQDPGVAAEAGHLVRLVTLGMPGMLLFVAISYVLESMGRPGPGFVLMVIGNQVNLALNVLLVFGSSMTPELGAEGAAIATVVTRLALGIGALGFLFVYVPEAVPFRGFGPLNWRDGARERRIGYAEGLSMGLESCSFTVLALIAGMIGPLALAGYSLSINLNMMIFTAALGFGGATAVLVGRARGAGDWSAVGLAGGLGLGMHTLAVGCLAVALVVVPGAFARLYTDAPEVLAAATPLVSLVGLVMLLDGAQRVVGNALRGCGESWVPTTCHLCAYAFLMVPLGWLFGLRLEMGAAGLLLAIALASLAALGLLGGRFVYLVRRRRRASPALEKAASPATWSGLAPAPRDGT
jgi:MATE family multidrug resistance protein